MATALELCSELGFLDGSQEGPSLGSPRTLLNDMKAYVNSHRNLEDAEALAHQYLHSDGHGENHWDHARLPSQLPWKNVVSGFLLGWPVDQDLINELVTAVFEQIMQEAVNETLVIDLEESAEIRLSETGTTDVPDSIRTSQVGGPITRLANMDPDLVRNLLDAGHTQPFPFIARSEKELLDIVSNWIESHPGQHLPGSKGLQTKYLGRSVDFRTGITFDTTLEEVYAEHRRIAPSLMAWVLSDASGSCMIVKASSSNRANWRGYHAWLGGDRGFTEKTIANSDKLLQKKPHISFQQKATHLSNSTDDEEGGNIAREPAVSVEKQQQERRWRFGSSNRSSPKIGGKRLSPPRYTSPSSRPGEKGWSSGTQHRQQPLRRSSTPNVVAGSSASGPESIDCSGNVNSPKVYKSLPVSPEIARHGGPKPTSTNVTKPSTSPNTSRQHDVREPTYTEDVTLNFFLSDEKVGAIPIAFSHDLTVVAFFEHALSAWNMLGSKARDDDFAAASVLVEGAQWPIVLPWGRRAAYEFMVGTIAKAKDGSKGSLQVQVKCIPK